MSSFSLNEKPPSHWSKSFETKNKSKKHPPWNRWNVSPSHKRIGDYMLWNAIGKGTFSKVVLGYHIPTHQKVAIKILEKAKIIDTIDIERILREINILKLTSHPNICQLYESLTSKNNYYLIMEYIEGGDLFEYIYKKKYLPEKKACVLFRQIISSIEFLQKWNITHRDIKPENILWENNASTIKIIDFGLSNFCEPNKLLKSSCGSPCYASPEMISGYPYKGIGADLWSSGVVLYCMLVGCLPFDDENIQTWYDKIRIGEFYLPSSLSSEVIDWWKRIWTVDPKKRITLEGIKHHKWFRTENNTWYKGIIPQWSKIIVDKNIIKEIKTKFYGSDDTITEGAIMKSVVNNSCNKYSATYYLYLKSKDKYFIPKTNAIDTSVAKHKMLERSKSNIFTKKKTRIILMFTSLTI